MPPPARVHKPAQRTQRRRKLLDQAVRQYLDPAMHLHDPLFSTPQLTLAGPSAVPRPFVAAEAPNRSTLDGWDLASELGTAVWKNATPLGQLYANVDRTYQEFDGVKQSFGGGALGTVAGVVNFLPFAPLAAQMTQQYLRYDGGLAGATMALNVLNPLVQLDDAVTQGKAAAQSGDSKATAEQAVRGVRAAASLGMLAAGAAGATARAGAGGRGGAPGSPGGSAPPPPPVPAPRPLPNNGFRAQFARRAAPWVIRTSEALTETTAPGVMGGRTASGPAISSLRLPEPVMPASPVLRPSLPPLPQRPAWMAPPGGRPTAAPGLGLPATPLPIRIPVPLVTTPLFSTLLPAPVPVAAPPAQAAQTPAPVEASKPKPQPMKFAPHERDTTTPRTAEQVREAVLKRLQPKQGPPVEWHSELYASLTLIGQTDPELQAVLEKVYTRVTNNPVAMADTVGELWRDGLALRAAATGPVTHDFDGTTGLKHSLTLDPSVPGDAFVEALFQRLGPENVLYLNPYQTFVDETFLSQVLATGRPPYDVVVGVGNHHHGAATHPLSFAAADRMLAADDTIPERYRTISGVLKALAAHPEGTAKLTAWREIFDSFNNGTMTQAETLYRELNEELGDLDAPLARAEPLIQIGRQIHLSNPSTAPDDVDARARRVLERHLVDEWKARDKYERQQLPKRKNKKKR